MSNEKLFIADKATQDVIKGNTDKIIADLQDYEKTKHKRYGIRIDKNDSNPDTRCEYILDAVGMKPARMNYLTSAFDIGSWADVFFVKENYPCMLKYDGKEAYKLNPNDYSKRIDGTPSDVSNKAFAGNAMSAIPLIWVSQYETANYEYMIVCDIKYDDSYHAYLHTRSDGSIADVFYERMFEGYFDGTRIRSLSGQTPTASQDGTTEISRARANGALWYTGTFAAWNMFEILLKIMSKTEDCQTAFGRGNCTSDVYLTTGQLNNKGTFFGYKDDVHAVKTFHCENWWGNYWERRAGLMCLKGKVVVKAKPPYNTTGVGYEDVGILYADATGGYVSKTLMNDKGRFIQEYKGSESTYTCDYHWHSNLIDGYALSGGYRDNGSHCGCGSVNLDNAVSSVTSNIVASLSCEQPAPLA